MTFKERVKRFLNEENIDNFQRTTKIISGLDIPFHTPKAMKKLRENESKAKDMANLYAQIMLGYFKDDDSFHVKTNKALEEKYINEYLSKVDKGGTLPRAFFSKVAYMNKKVGAADNTARTKRVINSILNKAKK